MSVEGYNQCLKYFIMSNPDLARFANGELGCSGGSMAILKIIQNERLIEFYGKKCVFLTYCIIFKVIN